MFDLGRSSVPSRGTVPRLSGDAALLRAAIEAATAGNQSAFARLVGLSSPSNVGKRLRGEVGMTEMERRLYRLLVAHPHIAQLLR
ncbi:MAG: hypothetical protein JWM95_4456 [Gemmatimonadetes bacterium]|nr:hypothetical protein [Gemmatimonadota bacterium]